MALLGQIILGTLMTCCVVGAFTSVFRPASDLGKSFHEGISAMSALFIPIVGMMVSVPYLVILAEAVFGKLFRYIGADPAIAGAMFIPSDCGGYALAHALASSPEVMVVALTVGVMTASSLAFNIPIGLSILKKADRPYMALGAMSGFLSIPFGVLTTCLILYVTKPTIRSAFSTTGPPDYVLNLDFFTIGVNLLPIVVFCVILFFGLKLFPNIMVRGFLVFGRFLIAVLTAVVAFSIVEHYTGFFTAIFGGWGFSPIIADEVDSFRAIELLGSIGMMLTGAFPMVFLIRKYLGGFLEKAGGYIGLEPAGCAGLVAAMANAVALYVMIGDMKPADKVVCISFCVCAGYALGDWIAFNVNFQPNLVAPVLVGQIVGGLFGVLFAKMVAVPRIPKAGAGEAAE